MKKTKKWQRKFSIFFATVLILTLVLPLNISAGNDATITIGSSSAAPGTTITVPITISGNTDGIIYFGATIKYNSEVLTLTDATIGSLTSSSLYVSSYSNFAIGQVYLDTLDWTGVRGDGEIVTLTFAVSPGASSDYEIDLDYNPHFSVGGYLYTNCSWDNVLPADVTIIKGAITVDTGDDGGDTGNTPDGFDIGAGYGGKITTITDGQYTITATTANYAIDEIWVDGIKLPAGSVQNRAAYTTTVAPTSSVFATFAHTINFLDPDNGSLSVVRVGGNAAVQSGDIVRDGEILTMTAVPEQGFELDGVISVTGLIDKGNNQYEVQAKRGTATPSVSASFKSAVPQAQMPVVTISGGGGYSLGETIEPLVAEVSGITDSGTLTYQWYSHTDWREAEAHRGTAIPGATEATYQLPQPTGSFYMAYYCVVTNTLGESAAVGYSSNWKDINVVDTSGSGSTQGYSITSSTSNGTGYTYSVSVGGEIKGSDLAAGSTLQSAADAGQTVSITITPLDGYGITRVNWNYVSVYGDPQGVYTVTMPNQNAALNVWTSSVKTVTVAQGITNGTVTTDAGADFTGGTVRVTPVYDDGYYVQSVSYSTDGGASWTEIPHTISGYSFTTQADETLVTAVFAARSEAVTVSNEVELRAVAAAVSGGNDYYGKKITLTDDIALTEPWVPIGAGYVEGSATPFSGLFDGGGHSVSGLEITREMTEYVYGAPATYLGLFGYVSNAEIRGVTVSGVITATATGDNINSLIVGGIVGSSANSMISDCVSAVDIDVPTGTAGGIAGSATGYVTRCVNYGSIIKRLGANSSTGGVVGSATNTVISQCGNYGDIATDFEPYEDLNPDGSVLNMAEKVWGEAGGVVGSVTGSATIESCFNKGSITGWIADIGGIIGYAADVDITDCYNTGALSQTAKCNDRSAVNGNVSGIVGIVPGYNGRVTITNSYNAGQMSNSAQSGRGTINDLYLMSVETNGTGRVDVTAFNAAAPGSAYQADVNNINGGYPLLAWEPKAVSGETYAVAFSVTPTGASVKVFEDATRTQEIQASGGVWSLTAGQYFYTVSASGYLPENGSFTVTIAQRTIAVTLNASARVSFTVTPPGASFTLQNATGQIVAPESASGGAYAFVLQAGSAYTYNASAPGYNGTTREFTAGDASALSVTLTSSDHPGPGGGDSDRLIYGSDNAGETSEITAGGTYYLAKGATGFLKIDTTQPVTLVGTGIGQPDMYTEIYIQCLRPGTKLTLRDVYISNEHSGHGGSNMIDFTGAGNYLYFSGTSILDQNSNASGFAMIHVNSSTELTVGGTTPSDTLYFYKREQGAGIGGNGDASGSEGQAPEYNGAITVTGGNLFMKNSKQGALIGSGANANSTQFTPGPITIEGGVLNLVAISRGAAIGGSAGSSGGARGSNVVINGGTISITIDYSGAAIGGGGYAQGNDSPGGTLRYNGGSIRTFLTRNAVEGDGTSLWPVTQPGVNDIVITAEKTNGSGQPVYLLKLDTSKLKQSARSFTVRDGNAALYSGGLHEYAYINEDLQKLSQVDINYTVDNWIPLSDPNLYLYLTGEDHALTVNSENVSAKWNAESKTFDVAYASGEIVSPGANTGETAAPGTTTVTDDSATTIVDAPVALADDPTLVVIDVDTGGAAVSNITAEVTAENVKSIAENGSSIEVRSDLGSVTLPNAAVADLAGKSGEKIDVKLTKNSADTYTLALTADDKAVAAVDGGVKLTLPAEDADAGTVAVLVHADGTEEVVKKSVGKDGAVTVPLDGSATVKIVDNAKSFGDVGSGAWYNDAVRFASSHELFQGTGGDKFSPDASMTRGMLVTVLHRLENEPAAAGELFADIAGGAYYADAVAWASVNGIVNGTGGGRFSPDTEITREQLAVMLYRYNAWSSAADGGLPDADLSGFPDAGSVSEYAEDAMKWAVGAGLIQGRGSALAPQGTATRAEVATILQRFIEQLTINN
jgi:hypothetical protein